MPPLNIDRLRYQALIGTGGIGSGMFVSLKGDHTLGREESRPAHFLDRRDYCKLHIIAHYVKVLLGPGFPTLLVSKVGADPVGQRLMAEMSQTGLDVRYVQQVQGAETLFSVCFLYPDGSGGNLTEDDSACSQVDAAYIARAGAEFARFDGAGIALAAPEVPLEARHALLRLATAHNFFRAGTFVSAEVQQALSAGLVGMLDLVALNLDEAAVLAGLDPEQASPEAILEAAAGRLSQSFPDLMISITAGKRGSWSWDGQRFHHLPAFPTEVVGTAGAGDAHLGGILAGLAAGLPLPQAQELGGLAAALAIASPHTIAPGVERHALWQYVRRQRIPISPPLQALLAT